ncbi:MAG: hypothetical protein JJE49_00815 [Peptostreptococcaceae bacterium]|nr:hypothetical protein [Peptostreptococcaceae bacterium]
MEIINILLIGNDMEYCKALSESISELSKEIMITLYDKRNMNLENIDHNSILVVEEEKDCKKIQGNDYQILLVESNKEACMDIENRIFRLYKYENVKELIRSLFIIYNVFTGKSITAISDNNCKLIAVTSSYGGGGKTSVSLGLAQEFVRFRGKKTLYINYEDCDGTWNYMDFQRGKMEDSIGSYLYYLNKGRSFDFNAFLKEDEYGVFYFKPSLGRNQLKALSAEDLCLFCNKLIETNMFEYIIFDCHACLDDSTLWLLKNSFRIIYLAEETQDLCAVNVTQRDLGAIEYIENKFSGRLGEKLIKVYNMHQAVPIEAKNGEAVYMEKDVNSFQIVQGIRKINIEREFGEGIKSIANRIEDI